MGVIDIVIEKPAEVSRSGECVSMTIKHTHRLDWLQQDFPWLSNIPIALTDFSRLFHDYVKHTPLQLTSAGFSMTISNNLTLRLTSAGFFMTISNTLTASTDFSRFFYDYIYHTHRLDWLQQVFPSLYQTHPSPWLTSAGCSMTMSNTSIASTDFSRFFHDYIKLDIVIEKSSEVNQDDGCVSYSHGTNCWSQSSRWMCLI
jgi:hypothetical protein